jgi:16S rRNA (guanine966-N2)-methyltransferase
MRIISGKYKGKKILFPKKSITRPLRDRVRGNIFNILQHSNKIQFEFKNSIVLDLFSGSGSFGLECLSRDVNKVFFFEKNSKAFSILKKNLNTLNILNENAIAINDDVSLILNNKLLSQIKPNLVFLDPPFVIKNFNGIIKDLKKIINRKNILVIHTNSKNNIHNKELNFIEERFYGISKIYFAKLNLT